MGRSEFSKSQCHSQLGGTEEETSDYYRRWTAHSVLWLLQTQRNPEQEMGPFNPGRPDNPEMSSEEEKNPWSR